MLQKATATFDPQAKTLVIAGELLPDTPLLHDMLIDLLHGVDQPAVSSMLVNRNNVLTYSVKFAESAGPSAADLDIVELRKEIEGRDQRFKEAMEDANVHIGTVWNDLVKTRNQLEEANSTIALLEDRLATTQKIAAMATDELAAIKTPQSAAPAPSNE